MQYGISMFPTDYSITPADLAVAAEARGIESIWFPEHSHIPVSRKSPWPGGPELPKPYYDVMDPFVALATAAAVTKKIKLATGICLVIQRDPIQTAKEICTLDTLSGGRFLFGVGAGWNAEEMADHGTKFEERMDVMRERIEAIKLICSKSKPEYHGKHVNFEPFMTWPKTVQKPHPPVLVGGGYPHGARRAAEYGDGWMPITGRGDIIAAIPKFRQMVAERDRDPDSVEITVFGVAPDAEKIKPYGDAGAKRVIFGLPSEGADTIMPLLDKMAEVIQKAK
ncbi:MAG TPA: LLM class F420-dependent oxidoreductase [Alphaproteobacteria bacterium]|nr:LLM class F420-dependent oxidoreductase [Alphaproteobacteria bacterium]